MNNKRGGVGAKILIVLILMLLAAGGGAYGYRLLDGNMASRDAQKFAKGIEPSDYDTEEAAQLQVYISNMNRDLETAKTRKEVYEILDEFKEDTAKLQTKAEKELEAARREVEEARKANQNTYGTGSTGTDLTQGNDQSQVTQQDASGSEVTNNNPGSGLTEAEDGSESSSGLFNSLFGNNND